MVVCMVEYRISEVAERTGFPSSTLRYYEEVGLLPEPGRTPAGHRVYGEEHLDQLAFVARAKRLGLSLEEIGELAALRADRDCRSTRVQLVGLLESKLAQSHEEIVEMTRFADQLEAVYERLTGRPAAEGRCGSDCGCSPDIPDSPVDGADPQGRPRLQSST